MSEVLRSSMLSVVVLLLTVESCSSYHASPIGITQSRGWTVRAPIRPRIVIGSMSKDNDGYDDDDDDDDDEIDMSELQDWRSFRQGLVSGSSESADTGEDELPASSSRPKSVSKKNEELLLSQNENLAKEYMDGVWAHDISTPEIGGLVCRLPLEAEIWRNKGQTSLGRKLADRLDLGSDNVSPDADNGDSFYQSSFSPLAAKTAFWYKGAQSIVQIELAKVSELAENGQIDPTKLSGDSAELLNLYLEYQDTWQEVCLVLENDQDSGKATTVNINRPMSRQLTENMAMLVLFGAFVAKQVSQTEKLLKFLLAFENECAVYLGGPDEQHDPAIMVHGIQDLEGAVEISPGSNIYQGGLDAAVEGVTNGKYNALDFRFFVGRHAYKDFQLERNISAGKYQAIACARALALKQCIALPKPLWHEVLELCGGELKDLSTLELIKRDDIQSE